MLENVLKTQCRVYETKAGIATSKGNDEKFQLCVHT